MNDKAETPSEGTEHPRSQGPGQEDSPGMHMGSSHSPLPYQPDPSSWQAGQYASDGASTPELSGETAPMPPPPSYSQAPASSGQTPMPQYGFTPPQGQPTQYMPPADYGQQSLPQGDATTLYNPSQQGGYSGINPEYSPQPPAYVYAAPKDPNIALLLELIGIAGFLGIGHIYAGKATRGIVLLVGWFIYDVILVTVILPLVGIGSVLTCGLGCLLFIPLIAIWLGVPIGSGFWLRNEMTREQMSMGIRR